MRDAPRAYFFYRWSKPARFRHMGGWNESCSKPYRAWEAFMTQTIDTNLGDLISKFYEHFLAAYGDEELASVATAAVINDLIGQSATPSREAAA